MPTFSKRSKARLETCDPILQQLMNEVIKEIDITIVCGARSAEAQLVAYNKGTSKVKKGKHNYVPSRAVDIQPYGVDLKEWEEDPQKVEWKKFCAKIMDIAKRIGVADKVRSGGLEWGWDFFHWEIK